MTIDQELRAAADELLEVMSHSPAPPAPGHPERSDELTVLELRPEDNTAAEPPNRRVHVAAGVAAALLFVLGVVIVADVDGGDVATGPASPLADADPVPYGWSRVPHDEAAFAGDHGQSMWSVTVGGPGFVAVGESGLRGNGERRAAVWTSVDGIDWSRVPHNEAVFGDARMNSITAGGPGLVAVGESGQGAAVWTSLDGITWSRVPHDEAVFGDSVFAPRMNSVTVGGPGLVAVGSDGSGQGASSNAVVWTSRDGTTWSRVPHNDAIFGRKELGRCCTNMHSVTVGGPGLVAVGSDWLGDGEDSRTMVWTSVDGIDWSRVPHNEAVFGDASMHSITAGGPGLVAVGESGQGAAVWTSLDGITWSRVPHDEALSGGEGTPPACCGTSMSSVTVGGPGLVAVGRDFIRNVTLPNGGWVIGAAVWTSVDGITWSRVPHDPSVFEAPPRPNLEIASITAGGPGLVAVGANTVHDFWATHNDSGESDAVVWVATLEE